jgi:polyhydroxybutyrate depolymerase
MLTVYPNGTTDADGAAFWNATDACCDFFRSGVDDAGYLASLIVDIRAQASVDPRRIFVVGHSNGGFMSYRMACDHADLIAAIASLAGATFAMPEDCRPSAPVAMLQIHGTADDTIRYEGGSLPAGPYPGAEAGSRFWAGYDGCDLDLADQPGMLDLETSLEGPDGPAETTVRSATDCAPGGHVELWTIAEGGHVPDLTDKVPGAMIGFLLAHPKP